MDKTQKSHNRMHRAVSGILESNQTIVNTIPGLKDAQEELDGYISETDRQQRGQVNNGIELTAEKQASRTRLNTSYIKIERAVVAFATNSKISSEKILKSKYQIADSDVKKMGEKDIFAKAYVLYGDAAVLGDKLLPFATKEDIEQLKEDADEYNLYIPLKRVQVSKSATSTQNLEESVDKANKLLHETMDDLMNPLEFMHIDFYRSYKNARVLVDPGFRKKTTPKGKEEQK